MTTFSKPRIAALTRRKPLMGAGVLVLATAGALMVAQLPANAVHDTGYFLLDGNVVNQQTTSPPPYDWSDIFTSAGAKKSGLPSYITGAKFNADYSTPDGSYFNSDKDLYGISSSDGFSASATWGCVTVHNPTPKDDILNTYAAMITEPAKAPDGTTTNPYAGDKVLYTGQERGSNNGSSYAGFWLLQKGLSCSGGSFTGGHGDGDLLVVSNYTNGGASDPNVSLFYWCVPGSGELFGNTGCTGSANGAGVAGPVQRDTGLTCGQGTEPDYACGIANNTKLGVTPWPPGDATLKKTDTASFPNTNTFVEAGVDLTHFYSGLSGGVPCFSTFLGETRSSPQITATLKDFATGGFNTCKPPITTKIGLADSVHLAKVSSTDTVFPAGDVTFTLYPTTDCTGSAIGSKTVTLDSSGDARTTDAAKSGTTPTGFESTGVIYVNAGSYAWLVSYTPSDGNIATSTTCSATQSDERATIAYHSPSPTS
jgi:hypothetical protein